MSVHWISFRISKKTVGRKTYDERYKALEEAIEEISTVQWKQTTSFIVFETTTDFPKAARMFKAAIAPSEDLFLMRKMDAKRAVICGQNDDLDIFDMMLDAGGKTYLETL